MAAKPKVLTREQVEGRKEKAVRAALVLRGDPDRADEIAEESLEDYAAERGFLLANGRRSRPMPRRAKTKEELQDEIDQLKAENDDLQEENEDLQDQLDTIADIVAPADDEEEGEEEDEYPQ